MTAQLDMFAPTGATAPANAAADNSLIGLKVKLDAERERPCCNNVCVIGAGKGPHAGELRCADCGQHRGWLSQSTAQWIESVATLFGAPTTPIVVRKSHTYEEETPHASNCEADKQRCIEEISTLIALEGFTPKDFFLTQPPPPTQELDRARWRAREQRRRPIARRMALLGVTAHDLAREPICVNCKPPSTTAEAKSSRTEKELSCLTLTTSIQATTFVPAISAAKRLTSPSIG